jgi:hypothetical protein
MREPGLGTDSDLWLQKSEESHLPSLDLGSLKGERSASQEEEGGQA